MASPPTQARLVVVKSMTYRGATKLWHNIYCLNSTTGPADNAHWTTFSDNVVNAEKAIFTGGQTIVETIGYEGGTNLPIFSKTYSTAATGSFTNYRQSPGDVAFVIRYTTTQRTSKNHPIYLFNYYHGCGSDNAGSADDLNTDQKNAATTYAAAWVTGFSDGTATFKKAGPRGAVAQSSSVLDHTRHRDFRN